jgi:hypothetical protein
MQIATRIFLDLLASACFVLALGLAAKSVDGTGASTTVGAVAAVAFTCVGISILRMSVSLPGKEQ